MKIKSKVTAEAGMAAFLPISTKTSSYHMLSMEDASTLIRVNRATNTTVYIPAEWDVDFPIGTQILIQQAGAGRVFIRPDYDNSTNICAADGVGMEDAHTTRAQHSVVGLIKIAADTWLLFGDLEDYS